MDEADELVGTASEESECIMPEQTAPEGGQTETLLDVGGALRGTEIREAQESAEQTAGTQPTDRDTPRFTQREFDHHITARLAEERKKTAQELENFRAEVGPRLEKLTALETAQIEADQAALTEGQRKDAELADMRAQVFEKDTRLTTLEAALQEAGRRRRQEQIESAINAATPNLLGVLREPIYRRFASAEEINAEEVAEAAQAAQAEVETMLRSAGYAPQGIQIGSPGSPPAEPQIIAQEQYETQLMELANRAEAGDDSALVEYTKLRANRPRS